MCKHEKHQWAEIQDSPLQYGRTVQGWQCLDCWAVAKPVTVGFFAKIIGYKWSDGQAVFTG